MMDFVRNDIKYGFIDNKGMVHSPDEITCVDFEKIYYLQTPEELLTNRVGWCRDCSELIRIYLIHHKIEYAVLFEEYNDNENNFYFSKTFVIMKNIDNNYLEVLDNSYKGYNSLYYSDNLRIAIKKSYNNFVEEVKSNVELFNYNNLFLGRYNLTKEFFDNKFNFVDFVKHHYNNLQKEDKIYETSCMAIVCCKKNGNLQVLTIENDNNQIDFPKGHVEKDETFIQTAIRECFEETHVEINEEDFIKELSSYSYNFNAGILRMENMAFYKYFKAINVYKTIKVFSFLVNEMQVPTPQAEERLINSKWYPINELDYILSYENSRELIRELRKFLIY